MPIKKLIVENFKGISQRTEFEIRPLTLFVGPNSSGKSSCIHALAVLAQTLKVPNTTEPIVLDDDNASVHLGRFIEVVHSKSYQDAITLGLEIDVGVVPFKWISRSLPAGTKVRVEWSFKCSLRTQEIRLENASIGTEKRQLTVRRKKGSDYELTDSQTGRKFGARLLGAFFPTIASMSDSKEETVRKDFYSAYEFLDAANWAIREEISRVHYLGPFREPPSRRYPTRGSSPSEVGPRGEATATLLANESVRSQSRIHTKQVSKWLATLGLAKGVEVRRVGKSDLFDVNVTLPDNETLPIADLGYGVSQALPVLAQCSFCEDGSVLLFEQPELHLHEGAAARLAEVFVGATRTKGISILAETHSKDLFSELIRLVNRKVADSTQIVAYDVERRDRASRFRQIQLEEIEPGYFECSHPWGRSLERP